MHTDPARTALADLLELGVIPLAGDQSDRQRIHYLTRRGDLVKVLPGVFLRRDLIRDIWARAAAVLAFDPGAVITGRAAAALTYWPELDCSVVSAALGRTYCAPAGFEFVRRRVPPELVVAGNGIRLTSPALTALDLCTTTVGVEAIDKVLQKRAATVDQLREALTLTPGRPHNPVRCRFVAEVKTEGCSELERTGHRTLLAAGLDQWVANRRLRVAGRDMRPDLRFTEKKLIIQFDGFTYHSSRSAFDKDREESILLLLDGYLVLRVTSRMVADTAEFVRRVKAALLLAAPYIR